MINTMKPIVKNSTVRYKDGWYRVKSLFKTHATLCGIFSGRIAHRKVPLNDMVEDHDAWYENWTQSETYKSM